ncbi:MAG: ABC transporter permease [Desulfovibrionaceae bacterium]|nr:ABC transporter permease [Desulfovibrionaceae bacterium]
MELHTQPLVRCIVEGNTLTVLVGGSWAMGKAEPPEAQQASEALQHNAPTVLRLSASPDLAAWDTSLLAFLVRLVKQAQSKAVQVESDALPQGLRRLLALTLAVPAKAGSAKNADDASLLASLGKSIRSIPQSCYDVLDFIGALARAFARLLVGKSTMRRQDLWQAMYECGVSALPIIALTNVLFGLILAFVGAVQLMQFGAQVYVAGLVGIGMLRVMGAVMVGVVMAGRVGAAYAALIGTMQVNEEVDALATFGFSAVEFLVLPRVLALMLMVPLLTIYADLMGIIGGFLVGVTMLGLSPAEYINATISMVPYKHGLIGLAYATVFGIIIGVAGCYQGIRCGRSAAAVGLATTAAVVQSIVWIIIATAIITIICNILRI